MAAKQTLQFKRTLAAIGIPFLFGAFFAAQLVFAQFILLFAAVCLSAAFFFLQKNRTLFFTLCALCGILCSTVYAHTRPVSPEELNGKTVTVSGVVSDCSQEGNRLRCVLRKSELSTGETDVTVRLTLYGADGIESGDTVSIRGTCRMRQDSFFDAYRYAYENGMDLYVSGQTVLSHKKGASDPLAGWIASLREQSADTIDRLFDPEEAAVLRGVLLGDSSKLSVRTKDLLNRSGLRHLVVVSGTHISLTAGLVYLLLKRLFFPCRLCAVSSILSALFLVLLTGCGIPAIRAGIMTASVFAGRLFFKRSDPLNSLCGAGMLIVLVSPYAVTSASFLLTFSATAGLFVLTPLLQRLLVDRMPAKLRRFSPTLLAGTAMIGPFLAVLPLSIPFFGGISLVSPLATLILAPVFPVLLGTGFLSLSGIPLIAPLSAWICSGSLFVWKATARLLANIPFSFLGTRSPAVLFWGVFSAILLCVLILKKKPAVFLLKQAIALILLLPVLLGAVSLLSQDKLIATSFSTGNVQGVLLEQGNTADLVILSGERGWEEEVISLLRSRNIRSLRSLLLLSEKSTSASAASLITELFETETAALYKEDAFAPYAKERLNLIKPPALLAENSVRSLAPGLYVRRKGGSFCITLTCGEKKICISDGLPKEDCAALFLSADDLSYLRCPDEMTLVVLRAPDHFTAEGGRICSAEHTIRTVWI